MAFTSLAKGYVFGRAHALGPTEFVTAIPADLCLARLPAAEPRWTNELLADGDRACSTSMHIQEFEAKRMHTWNSHE